VRKSIRGGKKGPNIVRRCDRPLFSTGLGLEEKRCQRGGSGGRSNAKVMKTKCDWKGWVFGGKHTPAWKKRSESSESEGCVKRQTGLIGSKDEGGTKTKKSHLGARDWEVLLGGKVGRALTCGERTGRTGGVWDDFPFQGTKLFSGR